MPLAIVDRQAEAAVALALRPRERGGRIEAARQQDDGARLRVYFRAPAVSRCLALAAAGLAGYLTSSASSVFCAPRRSPMASCEPAILSSASGALASSGQAESTFCQAAIACLWSRCAECALPIQNCALGANLEDG